MPIRLIAMDMDDTLLNSEGEISARNLAALDRAKSGGARIVLASGRMIESMLDAAERVGVNAPLIAYNGAAVYDARARRILRQFPVPAGAARELCALAERLGIHAQGYAGGGYFFPEHDEFSERYAESVGVRGSAAGLPLSEYIAEDLFKILLIGPEERIAEALPLFRKQFEGVVNCANSKPIYIECVAPGVDKGGALQALAQDLGIPREEILAFGDGQNDLEMLRFAGLGYAMGNAGERVRAQAPRVAPSNDEDGVAQVIEQLVLRREG